MAVVEVFEGRKETKMEKTVRAIIIDDNKLAVANLKERLNANSLINVVATFSNGSDALDFIVNNGYSFDLILMDIILPKLDGIELLEEMKSRNISKKVIILSSYKDESVIRQCSNYSITHYMLKPYSYMSLEKRIIEAVNFKEVDRKSVV